MEGLRGRGGGLSVQVISSSLSSGAAKYWSYLLGLCPHGVSGAGWAWEGSVTWFQCLVGVRCVWL